MKRRKLKKMRKKIIVLLIFIFFGYFFLLWPILKIKAKAKKVELRALELKKSFSKNDIDLLENELNKFAKEYKGLEKEAKSVYWTAYIPFLGSYTKDFRNGIESGTYLIKAGQLSLKAISPYADLIGFKKGEGSFIEKSAENRLQTAVLTLDKVLGNIDEISKNLAQVEKRISKINPDRYPKKIGDQEIQSKVKSIKDQIEGVSTLFVDAKPFLKKLPEIFGKDNEKTYLVLFQNDKELRASGGFLTAYAIFRVEKGKIKVERSEDIYSLDNSIPKHPKAPDKILIYHKKVNKFYIRDSNLSPDFVESIKLFQSLYEKSSQKVDYDGIIAIDSNVLVDFLRIFGDTEANGVIFSAKKDKRCDCPQVLYKLFDMVDRPTPYIRANRKGILGDLMFALFYKAIGFSPSRYWGKLSENIFSNLQKKHILLYFVDPTIQKSIERLNYSGKIQDFQGDYLHINDVNFAGAKSNLFVSHYITSKTDIGTDGTVKRELIIEYKNPYHHSDCNLERGKLCLNATLRDWVRIYVPQGAKLISFKGSEKKVKVYNDLGKTVFEGFLRVNPQGKAQISITYTLLKKIKDKSNYKIKIQKQPGTEGHMLKVYVDKRKVFDGKLDKDKVIKNK